MLRKCSLVLDAVINSLMCKLSLFCLLSQSKDRVAIASYAQRSCEERS